MNFCHFLFSHLPLFPSTASFSCPSAISNITHHPHQIRQRVPVRPGLLPHHVQQGGEGKSENIISLRISRLINFQIHCHCHCLCSRLCHCCYDVIMINSSRQQIIALARSKWCHYDQWLWKVIRPLKTGDPQSWADQTGREKPQGPQEEEANARRGFTIILQHW